MPPAPFHDIDGDLSDHNVGNSDNDLVTSCFIRILIDITSTCSLLLYFVLEKF